MIALFHFILIISISTTQKAYSRANNAKQKKCMRKLDVEICYTYFETQEVASIKNVTKQPVNDCVGGDICSKLFQITHVDVKPYTYELVVDVLHTCCGQCMNFNLTKEIDSMFHIPPPERIDTHFIFPVLGRPDIHSMFGYHFIPLIENPRIDLFTIKQEDLMPVLLASCVEMWPLTVISLLMVTISGFVGWLLEMPKNSEEFPRPFFAGLIEGCWWAFITMTTVGYGDKVPRTIPARLYSMVWIVMGITLVSLVTAVLNTAVMGSGTTIRESMNGKNIGTLRHRTYEAQLVSQYGGMLHEIEFTDAEKGLRVLIQKLQNEEIDGFLLERLVYMSYLYDTRNNTDKLSDEMKFLKKNTLRRELPHRGSQFSYGILVKHMEDFNFLFDYISDNRIVLNTCNDLFLNNISYNLISGDSKDISSKYIIFSSSSRTFKKCFVTLSIVVSVIVGFGLIYESVRYMLNFGNYERPLIA